jgi:hypothetical protein
MSPDLLPSVRFSLAHPDLIGVALFMLAIAGIVSVLTALFLSHLPSAAEQAEIDEATRRLRG